MKLYLDSEYNGHGGDLISLALAAPTGSHWYGILRKPMAEDLHPWVAENVIPVLDQTGVGAHAVTMVRGPSYFRESLHEYLVARRHPSQLTIYADWPDDFAHLLKLMRGDSYDESWMVPCTMQLIVTPEGAPKPEIPHNALSDAIALMNWHSAEETLIAKAVTKHAGRTT